MTSNCRCGLLLLLAGCGSGFPEVTSAGRTLLVKEQIYGQADYFCGNLANGQFEVLLTDMALCDALKSGPTSKALHTVEELNLRLIFPSTLTVVPKVNTFKVGTTDCSGNAAPGTQATVYFSHNTAGNTSYDLNLQASSGTVSVTDYNKTAGALQGSYDVTIGSDHLVGTFDAKLCGGVVPGVGK